MPALSRVTSDEVIALLPFTVLTIMPANVELVPSAPTENVVLAAATVLPEKVPLPRLTVVLVPDNSPRLMVGEEPLAKPGTSEEPVPYSTAAKGAVPLAVAMFSTQAADALPALALSHIR